MSTFLYEAYNEGRDAYYDGVLISNNPYSVKDSFIVSSKEFADNWEAGWLSAEGNLEN